MRKQLASLIIGIMVFGAIAPLFGSSASASGITWHTETVDSNGNAGYYASLAFDSNGNPAISYFDYAQASLKYACWNGTSWSIQTVDNTTGVGQFTSLAFDPVSKQPGISYYDATNANLKYARWNVTSWAIQTVDNTTGVGSYTSLAFNSTGKPAISYYDAINARLKYACWDGTKWRGMINVTNPDIVDNTLGVGTYTSLAFNPFSKQPAISYYDATNANLKYASWNGTNWDTIIIDTASGVGTYSSLAFDALGYAGISYYSGSSTTASNPTVKYEITGTASTVNVTLNDGAGGGLVHYNDVSVPSTYTYFPFTDRSLYISAQNQGASASDTVTVSIYVNGNLFRTSTSSGAHVIATASGTNIPAVGLKYAHWDGLGWDTAMVDTGGVGEYSSLAFDPAGRPGISYFDSTNVKLKYTYWDGTKWRGVVDEAKPDIVDIVDNTVGVGYYISLAFDKNGNPSISYYDATNGYLKYATTARPNSPSPPYQPSNIAPASGTKDISLTPILKSSAFSDPDTGDTHAASQWQITITSGNYSSPIFDSTSTIDLTQTSLSSGYLSYNTTYYWQVRHQDSYGIWSDWSTETSFTTVVSGAPSQPVNIAPANGTKDTSLTPILESSAFSDPDAGDTHAASQWQVTITSGNYSSLIFDSSIDPTHLTQIPIPSGYLDHDTTYHWQVRYQDSYGIWSPWSTQTPFTTIASLPPNQPSNLSPADGETGVRLTMTLKSSPFSTPDGGTHAASQWQVTTTLGNYSSPVFDSNIDPTHLTQISVPSEYLSYNTTYYWRVRYQDSYGMWSPWSTQTSFTTVASGAPYQPLNIAPANGTEDISLAPILKSSTFSDPDAGDTHTTSRWQVTTTSGDYSSPVFDSYIDSTDLTQISLPSGCLGYGTTYYWHVRYQDSQSNWSPWSNQTSFTTVASLPPNQPINLSPLDNTTVSGFTPTLQSSDFFDPDGGTHTASQWQVTTTSGNYSSPIFDSRVDTIDLTEISLPSGVLSPNDICYWRVSYQDSQNNWSPWSKETSFSTITIPLPTANFSASAAEIASGGEVTFTDLSENATLWIWNLGDNTTVTWSTINRPPDGELSHTYTIVGTYNVSLTVSNLAGNSTETKTGYITVYTPPQASFSAPPQAEKGQAVRFTDSSVGATSWAWDFNNDGTVDSTVQNPSYTYETSGTYIVSLKITGPKGSATTTKLITVVAPPGTGFRLWMIGAIVAALIVIGGIVFLVRRRLAA